MVASGPRWARRMRTLGQWLDDRFRVSLWRVDAIPGQAEIPQAALWVLDADCLDRAPSLLDHAWAEQPMSVVVLRAATGFRPWPERCRAPLAHTAALMSWPLDPEEWRQRLSALAGLGSAPSRLGLHASEHTDCAAARWVRSAVHDVRNLLGGISVNAQLLAHAAKEAANARRIQRILHSLDELEALLRDIHLLAKAYDPQVVWAPTRIRLDLVVQGLCAELDHNNRLMVQTEAVTAIADESFLAPAIQALVNNALAYSPAERSVAVRVFSGPSGCGQLDVIDHGAGVPDAEREWIFEPFARGSNVGDVRGRGLGLAIAQRILTGHGAELEFASTPGAGTRVTVVFAAVPSAS